MTQPMLQLRTATGGSEPVTLEEGRLAVDVTGGKLYVGDVNDDPYLIAQSVALDVAANTPTYPKPGHFWYETDTGNLNIYDGSAYQQVGGGFDTAADYDVTGAWSFQGTTQVYGDDPGTAGPTLELFHDSASPAIGDESGAINFRGLDSGSAEADFAQILADYESDSIGGARGRLTLSTYAGGGPLQQLVIDHQGAQFNRDVTLRGTASSPILEIFHESASPSTGDLAGQIDFYANDTGSNKELMGRIAAEYATESFGSGGEIYLGGTSDGVFSEGLRVGGSRVTIGANAEVHHAAAGGYLIDSFGYLNALRVDIDSLGGLLSVDRGSDYVMLYDSSVGGNVKVLVSDLIAGHTHTAAETTSGTFANARISESSVTQHQSALTIEESQITDGSILARLAAAETVTGAWTFDNSLLVGTGTDQDTDLVVANVTGLPSLSWDESANMFMFDKGLHVQGSSVGVTANGAADTLVVESGGSMGMSLLSSDNAASAIYFGSPSDDIGAYLQWHHDNGVMKLATFTTGADLILGSGGAGAEAVRIASDGKVGIGTSSPSRQLDVEGDVIVSGDMNVGNTGLLTSAASIPASSTTTVMQFNQSSYHCQITGLLIITMQDNSSPDGSNSLVYNISARTRYGVGSWDVDMNLIDSARGGFNGYNSITVSLSSSKNSDNNDGVLNIEVVSPSGTSGTARATLIGRAIGATLA